MRVKSALAAVLLACVPRADTAPAPLTAPTAYEGRLPCDDCSTIFTRLVLNPDGTYLMEEEFRHTWDGHRRYEHRGRWVRQRGTAKDPQATVYRLESDDPEVARSFVVLQGGLRLQAMDHSGEPVEAVPPATLLRADP